MSEGPISIGFDGKGDEHLIPEGDDPTLHQADPLCGCNPDSGCDDSYTSVTVTYWWNHHHLGDA